MATGCRRSPLRRTLASRADVIAERLGIVLAVRLDHPLGPTAGVAARRPLAASCRILAVEPPQGAGALLRGEAVVAVHVSRIAPRRRDCTVVRRARRISFHLDDQMQLHYLPAKMVEDRQGRAPMALRIVYRNPRRSDELGVKIVPDELRAEAERRALEDLGFIVISITTVADDNGQPPSARPEDC